MLIYLPVTLYQAPKDQARAKSDRSFEATKTDGIQETLGLRPRCTEEPCLRRRPRPQARRHGTLRSGPMDSRSVSQLWTRNYMRGFDRPAAR